MKKSTVAYDQRVLGIVSTRPGMVMGSVDKEGVNAMPVALSGRVPVKVSARNGPIKAGDYLTTSSIPGVAMKATRAGEIIGTAMTDYKGEDIGKVVVFVKNGSSLGSNSDEVSKGIDLLTQLLGGPTASSNVSFDISDTATGSADLTNTGNTLETNLIGYVSGIVTSLFNKTVAFFGDVLFHGDVSILGRATFNSDSGGFAVINAGSLAVEVTFDKEYQNIPVITASPDTAVLYSITDVSTKGFKITVTQIETHDIKFSWIATAIKNAKTFVGLKPTSVPSASVEPILLLQSSPSAELTLLPSPLTTSDATESSTPVASQSAVH
jgi:hypothetical protein